MSNIRLFHPENIIENTTTLLSKEHAHYVVNVMRLKRGSNLNFFKAILEIARWPLWGGSKVPPKIPILLIWYFAINYDLMTPFPLTWYL